MVIHQARESVRPHPQLWAVDLAAAVVQTAQEKGVMGFGWGLRWWRTAAQRSQTFERCHCAHAAPQCMLQFGDRCGVALQHMQCFREAIDGALA